MKHLVSIIIVLTVMNLKSEAYAQSEGSTMILHTNVGLMFSRDFGNISESVENTFRFSKPKSKLLTLAEFTLKPKTVFLCCTKGGYGFYFKF